MGRSCRNLTPAQMPRRDRRQQHPKECSCSSSMRPSRVRTCCAVTRPPPAADRSSSISSRLRISALSSAADAMPPAAGVGRQGSQVREGGAGGSATSLTGIAASACVTDAMALARILVGRHLLVPAAVHYGVASRSSRRRLNTSQGGNPSVTRAVGAPAVEEGASL